jgi:hypothetical protein
LDLLTPYTFTPRDNRQYSAIAILHILQFTVTHEVGFSVFTSRILTTDLLQSHCNFKSHMKSYFPSLISFLPLFCNCQFRRLDSVQFLASWRPETRHFTSDYCSIVKVTLRLTVSQSVSHGVEPHLGLMTR